MGVLGFGLLGEYLYGYTPFLISSIFNESTIWMCFPTITATKLVGWIETQSPSFGLLVLICYPLQLVVLYKGLFYTLDQKDKQ